MLRDAIERITTKILKEEYGIETPKEIADKLSKDDQDYGNYQIRLTNVGDHKIRGATAHVEKIVCDDDPLDWTVIPPDEQDDQDECPVYQVTLLKAGENREDLIKFIANARMIEPSYAEALVDHVPSVIVRNFTKKAAMTIVAELAKLKADSMLERTVFINSVHKQRL